MMRALALVVALVAASSARAQALSPSLDAMCASSFGERFADAKRAVVRWSEDAADYEKARPAIEWFEEHCRFLSEFEIAIRKLDDENAFVCDTKNGRPKNLTADLVIEYQIAPTIGTFQEQLHVDHQCLALDRAKRIALVFDHEPSDAEQLEFLCRGEESERCTKARAALAAWRAKNAKP